MIKQTFHVKDLPNGYKYISKKMQFSWGGRTTMVNGSARQNLAACLALAEQMGVFVCVWSSS
jgi:hypothetical protein